MPKVKLTSDPIDKVGPLPDGPDDLMDSPSSPSTGSGKESNTVTEGFAGDLLGLPFEAAHLVEPAIEPLSRDELDRLAKPFANILNKYDLGAKLSRDEIVLAFYLTVAIATRVRAVSDAKKLKKAKEEMIEKAAEASSMSS